MNKYNTQSILNIFFLIAIALSSGCGQSIITDSSTSTPAPSQTPTDRATQSSTNTPAPTKTYTPRPTPTISLGPTQIGGGSSKLIFNYDFYEYNNDFPNIKGKQNIFIVNADGTDLKPLTNMEGFNFLKDVSPDGKKVLIASVKGEPFATKTADLYLVNLETSNPEPVKLVNNLGFDSFLFTSSARWLDNEKIIYIGQGEEGFGIYIINADGMNAINIERNDMFEILAINKNRVYWNKLVDTVQNENHVLGKYVWWSNLDGSGGGQLVSNGKQINAWTIAFSPDGTKVAWVEHVKVNEATNYIGYLYIASLSDMDHPSMISTLTYDVQLWWRRNSSQLVVFDYGSTTLGVGSTDDPFWGLYELSEVSGEYINTHNFHLSQKILGEDFTTKMQCSSISPDDQLLPCITTSRDNIVDGFQFGNLNYLNLETSVFSEVRGLIYLVTYPDDNHDLQWVP